MFTTAVHYWHLDFLQFDNFMTIRKKHNMYFGFKRLNCHQSGALISFIGQHVRCVYVCVCFFFSFEYFVVCWDKKIKL